jgi:hypothetical protein
MEPTATTAVNRIVVVVRMSPLVLQGRRRVVLW